MYELRLTSFDSREVRVDRIDVLTAPASARAIASHDSSALARMGNLGNSNGAHLHFGINDTPELGGNGLPFVFDSFELLMMVPRRPDWREHVVRIPPGQGTRRNEMPLSDWVIRFP